MRKSNAAKVPVGRPFQPGNKAATGRPKGIVQQIREVTNDGKLIIDTILEIMNDPKTSKKDRLDAAKWLKEHGFGKSPEITLTGSLSEGERSQATAALADTELEQMARLLKPAPTAAPLLSLSPNPSESLKKPTD